MLTYATTIPTDIKTHNSPDVWCERYGAIVADPPWTFQTYSERGKGRSAERHYRCMTIEEIKALPVCQDRRSRLRALLVGYESDTAGGAGCHPRLGLPLQDCCVRMG